MAHLGAKQPRLAATISMPPAIETLLVPLDGSQPAERALPVALHLARACDAELVLVRTYSVRPETVPSLVATHQPCDERALDPLCVALQYLEDVEHKVERQGVRVYSHALQWPPAYAIARLAAKTPGTLVVMWTRAGEPAASGTRTVSVAREVLLRAEAPVLLLHHQAGNPLADAEGQKAVFVLLHEVTAGARALHFGLLLARELLHSLTVWYAPGRYPSAALAQQDAALYAASAAAVQTETEAALRRLQRALGAEEVAVATRALAGAEGPSQIGAYARQHALLLVVEPQPPVTTRAEAADAALAALRDYGRPVLFVP
jgi:nucleotide-binding universal stress UspA family protein